MRHFFPTSRKIATSSGVWWWRQAEQLREHGFRSHERHNIYLESQSESGQKQDGDERKIRNINFRSGKVAGWLFIIQVASLVKQSIISPFALQLACIGFHRSQRCWNYITGRYILSFACAKNKYNCFTNFVRRHACLWLTTVHPDTDSLARADPKVIPHRMHLCREWRD